MRLDMLSIIADVEMKNIKRTLILRKERLTMSDQTIKADADKPKLSLVPTEIINQIAIVREYGINKYPSGGPNNWRNVEIERYKDAAYRHLLAYIADPTGVDEESGLPHLSHLACNIAFLCDLEKNNKPVEIRKCAQLPKTTIEERNAELAKNVYEPPKEDIFEEPTHKLTIEDISEEEQEELRKYLEYLSNNKEARKELKQW